MMNMKKTWILLTLFCAMTACKRVEVKFTYSPDAPRAGQTVRFSNLSSSGEEWEWTFGDGATSTLKSPTHVYKKPGKYRVALKVDQKRNLTAPQELTVYDTVPTFVCQDSIFFIFVDYKFTANFYNPYNYAVSYLWTVNDSIAGTESSLTTYFTEPGKDVKVGLLISYNNETTDIEQSFTVNNLNTNSLLLRTPDGDYRQRIFGERAENVKSDPSATPKLEAEQDTFQVYNRDTFRLSDMRSIFPELEGFHIAKRKFYYRTTDGLWIANIDGTNPVQIDTAFCMAMTLDMTDNRIYWSNESGVWYMPFVGSDNNKFVTVPQQLNNMNNVIKLSADAEKK